jgi:hypothetical protein
MPELQEFLLFFESVRDIKVGISFSNPRIHLLLVGRLKIGKNTEIPRHSQILGKDTNGTVQSKGQG